MRISTLSLGAVVLLAGSAGAQTDSARAHVDQIVARYAAARGGADRVTKIRTVWLAGRITLGGNLSGIDTVEMARPLRIRTTIHFDQGVLIQGYDGHTAWGLNPFAGDTAPHPLDAATAKNVLAGGDIDGPLLNYAAKGNRVTLTGVDTADGRPAYALRVVRPDSTDDTYFVDTASYALTKWQGHRVANGEPVVYESYFRNYRRVGGVMVAFRIDSGILGQPAGQHMTFDSIVFDAPIADTRFSMPTRESH